MIEVRQTAEFSGWLNDLSNDKTRGVITSRLARVALGNFGDHKSIGDGVSELRIDFGPGYRVYFTKRGKEIVILLCGGDKGSQTRDIKAAKALAANL